MDGFWKRVIERLSRLPDGLNATMDGWEMGFPTAADWYGGGKTDADRERLDPSAP